MKKFLVLILAAVLIFSFAGCQNSEVVNATENVSTEQDFQDLDDSASLTVAVSIVPVATFVEKVAGDNVDIVTVVPAGNSPANYQPTTVEMQALSDADVYFVIQVPTETANILGKIDDFNSDVELVNLRDAVSAEYDLRYMSSHSHDEDEDHAEADDHDDGEEEHHEEATVDPHIWLSPKRVQIMVQTIADSLSEIDSANADMYQANAAAYIHELSALDEEIEQIVNGMDKKAFMIYHGAYGYFSDDYGLEMISLESDGKEATPATLEKLIEEAKDEEIKTIFYQAEFDDSQAQTVAEELGGTVAQSAPLSPDYVEALRTFANALAGS